MFITGQTDSVNSEGLVTIAFSEKLIVPEELIVSPVETISQDDENMVGRKALDLVILRNDGQQDSIVQFDWFLVSFEEIHLKI